MEIIKVKDIDYEEMCEKATIIVIEHMKSLKRTVNGFATGPTPIGGRDIMEKEFKKKIEIDDGSYLLSF